MALDLKTTIHTENDCKTLVITDITKPRSSANINGWGGQNASPNLAKINLVLTIIYPIIDGEDLIPVPISFPLTEDTYVESTVGGVYSNDFWEFDGPNRIDDFIFKIDMRDFLPMLNSYLASNLILDSSGSALQLNEEIFIDNVYQVKINITNADNSEIINEFDFCFANTCTIQEKVDLMYSSIDVFCEDCDRADVETALLAESLLEELKNSCENGEA
tara:strand:+ start:1836 stop:2489 length:654 start_codon:yes stop_codon:yes gene_type:complete